MVKLVTAPGEDRTAPLVGSKNAEAVPPPSWAAENIRLVRLWPYSCSPGWPETYSPLPLGFGLHFLFGNIAAMVAIRLYGPVWGTATAIGIAASTFVLWGHWFGVLIMSAEAAVVAVALARNGRQNLVYCDMLFWLAGGIPLVALFYGGVLELPVAVSCSLLGSRRSTG